jgi:hypothetical protein
MNKKQPTLLDDEKINTHESQQPLRWGSKLKSSLFFAPKP